MVIAKSLCLLASITLLSIVGCDEKKIDDCPNVNPDFFKKSIKQYIEKHPDSGKADEIVLTGSASYNTKEKAWMVPFSTDGHEYFATVGCEGHVELSYKTKN
ncbi:hypothetical protein [Pseudomonas oryzihabitans]|uniref:hypothetical protein n=1 Tax=Pseudomonas oryzihabitans TaxID=47885 RepID=UPI00286CCA20|nr:hypothetical protein [Pseudomonas psychrotolerans]